MQPKTAMIAAGVGLAALGGLGYWQRNSLRTIRVGTEGNPAPVASTSGPAKRIPAVAARVAALWPELTGGGAMPEAALEIAMAQAWLESGVAESGGGGWWKDKTEQGAGNMVGSGNLGARQCGSGDEGGAYYRCVLYGDSRPATPAEIAAGKPKQIPIKAAFRYYTGGLVGGKNRSAGEAAAYDFLKDITRTFPAKEELAEGDVLKYAQKQYTNHYYSGFGATERERVNGYARAIASHLPSVAHALGHKKIYAKVSPELWPQRAQVAGIEGAGMLLAGAVVIVAALLVAGGVHAEKANAAAIRARGALRAVGADLLLPATEPMAGYAKIEPNSPAAQRVQKAIGDELYQIILGKGYSFQMRQTAAAIAGEADVDVDAARASDAQLVHVSGAELLEQLFVSGTLPRARAIPGSNGYLFWYLEGTPIAGSDVDDAISTASDVSRATSSALDVVSAISQIAKRHSAPSPDQPCRRTVKAWVDAHPLLARLFKPDLRPLAASARTKVGEVDPALGVAWGAQPVLLRAIRGLPVDGVGVAVDALGAPALLIQTRVAPESIAGYVPSCVDDVPVAIEDSAVAQVGATQDEFYEVASKAGAGVANIWVPGIGPGLKTASDAVKRAIDQKTGHRTNARARSPDLDFCRQQNTDLAVVRKWVQRHPWLARWTTPRLPGVA